jgi:hypothetical protein
MERVTNPDFVPATRFSMVPHARLHHTGFRQLPRS